MARYDSTQSPCWEVSNVLLVRNFAGRDLFGELAFAFLKETKPDALFLSRRDPGVQQRYQDIGIEVENVDPLLLPKPDRLAAHDQTTLREAGLLLDLMHPVAANLAQSQAAKFRIDPLQLLLSGRAPVGQ